MITSSPLEKALPGRENAKDWLTMKIVECLSVPMDDETSKKLANYNSAYNAICQWEEDQGKEQLRESDHAFSMSDAKAWTSKMQNSDGTKGAHWTIEQVKQILAQRNLSIDPISFWATINMIYSDYSQVAKKYNVGNNLDFYVDMAKAFLNDKDAAQDKLEKYYQYIVK